MTMVREWNGWIAAAMLAAGVLLVPAVGCKEKEPAPSASQSASASENTTHEDAVLESMRQQATMPADRNATRPATSSRPAQMAGQENSLFPKELFQAAQNGDLEKVKSIMMTGRPVMVIDEQGSSPVHYAAGGGQVRVLEFLLGLRGFTANEVNQQKVTPLHWAAVTGHRNAVDFLASRGAKIDARDSMGRTPLFAAAAAGRADVVDYLIQKGADIEAKDNNGQTPLGMAMIGRQSEVVKMLTDHGAKAATLGPTPPAQSNPAR